MAITQSRLLAMIDLADSALERVKSVIQIIENQGGALMSAAHRQDHERVRELTVDLLETLKQQARISVDEIRLLEREQEHFRRSKKRNDMVREGMARMRERRRSAIEVDL